MRWLLIFSILICMAFFCQSCSFGTAPEDSNDDPNQEPQLPVTIDELTKADLTTAESINEFGMHLYRKIDEDANNNDNIFISPLSVAFALGMAYNGAGGETRAEMQQALGFEGMSVEDINQSYFNVINVLCNLDPDVIVSIANSFWFRKGTTPNPDFITLNQNYFNAEVREIEFVQPWAADTINAWIEYYTNDMIQDMLSPPLDPSTIAMLINAIYFKGDWTVSFDPESTVSEPFYKDDGSTVSCDMMKSDTTFLFLDSDIFNAVSLPYGNKDFGMMILLPDEGYTIHDVTQQLAPANWAAWREGLTEQEVMLGLPKFLFEYSLTLNETLKALGIQKAFESGIADFTNMFSGRDLWISDVLHKAKVQVDELGTEAAAVTIIVFIDSVSDDPIFTCNKPFVFAIYEKVTGTILFVGKIAEPVWEE